MTCSNCKATMTCGCQKRVASNGVSVCSNCQASYEASLGKTQPAAPQSGSAPSNVTVRYNPARR